MLSAELIEELDALRALEQEWAALAEACGLPLMAPSWLLQWWEHLAPKHAEPRTVVVRDDSRLIALAPFYVANFQRGRVDYRLPGIEIASRLSPLAPRGSEWGSARLIAETLARAHPHPDLIALEGHPLASPWPLALRSTWPGRVAPTLRQYLVQGAPTISLQGHSFESWLASKSANFRGQMRRLKRQFAASGGIARISTRSTIGADVDIFMHLHASRWQRLGRSGVLHVAAGMGRMLRGLADDGLRLWILEIEGAPISAQLFFALGGGIAYVNGGWDERFARLKPAMLGILLAIEDCFERKERWIDLGGGEQAYKLRLADGNEPVAWSVLITPGWRRSLTSARTMPMLARHAARDTLKRSLSDERTNQLRALRRKIMSPR